VRRPGEKRPLGSPGVLFPPVSVKVGGLAEPWGRKSRKFRVMVEFRSRQALSLLWLRQPGQLRASGRQGGQGARRPGEVHDLTSDRLQLGAGAGVEAGIRLGGVDGAAERRGPAAQGMDDGTQADQR